MRDYFKEFRKRYKKGGVLGACQDATIYLADKTAQTIRTTPRKALNSVRSTTSIWEKDWDICLIIDGCRADTFERVYSGDSERIYSVASTSRTWISRTFLDTDTSSVGYITANPFADMLDPADFAYLHLEPVQNSEYGVETVSPETLADHAIHVWRRKENYDLDQLVVHFMQPHVPFRSRPEWFDDFDETWGSSIWEEVNTDHLDKSEFFEAYRDNLKWVLNDGVKRIGENTTGRIAITADHGNAAGEWGYYGHPLEAPVEEVRAVPWTDFTGNDTHSVVPEVDTVDDVFNPEEQLEALGYR